MAPFIKIIDADIKGYLNNENTCYVIKYLIKVSESTKKKAITLCHNKLQEMLAKQHSCRLIYTLCNHSDRFRDTILVIFKSQFSKLLSTLPGAILLSLLISNLTDISQCNFILEELQRNPDIIKMRYFGRAFATYMNKCSMEQLNKIAGILDKNMSFLLHDNYGNYILQIFIERDCRLGIDLCQSALTKIYKKSFIRRYCRYVLLKAVMKDTEGLFIHEILELVTKEPHILDSIIRKKFSQAILLLCLSKVESNLILKHFLVRLKGVSFPTPSDTEGYQSTLDFFKELQIVKKFHFVA